MARKLLVDLQLHKMTTNNKTIKKNFNCFFEISSTINIKTGGL
jgi:hypothetical protein